MHNTKSKVYVKYCRYTEVIGMMKKDEKRKGKPLKAHFFSALELALVIILLISVFVFDDDICNITGGTEWGLFSLYIIIIILVFSGVCIKRLREECLEKAGYGIKALERWGASIETGPTTSGDRPIAATFTSAGKKAIVDIIDVWEWMDYSYREPHTRIRVEHAGEIPCVVEVRNGRMDHTSLFDKHAYMEGKKRDLDPRDVSIESEINENVVAEWIRHVFDNQSILELKGILRIEPEQVYFLEQGKLLDGEYLRDAANVLISLAEKIEKGYCA